MVLAPMLPRMVMGFSVTEGETPILMCRPSPVAVAKPSSPSVTLLRMQEMLVRGYLYQMIKSNSNIAAAIIVSTGLFTFAHGGAFEAGILPVLNVITMSLFMTAVLEYTGSLIAPIVIHFLWNGVGAIILGGVSLAEDYPHLFDMTIHGNPILSGGSCKIEGSIIVLFMNLAFLIGFVAAKKRKDRNR
jgi:membrane protease YdiL (CAAX protease family)